MNNEHSKTKDTQTFEFIIKKKQVQTNAFLHPGIELFHL